MVNLDEGIQDEEQWAQTVQVQSGYMWGIPKPGSMSDDAPILIHLNQWQEKKWVSMTEFKAVTDDM